MNYNSNSSVQSPYNLVIAILLGYYCLYDLSSVQSIFPTQLSNLVVLGALCISIAYTLYNNRGRFISIHSKYWIPFILILLTNLYSYNFEKSYVFQFIVFVMLLAAPLFTHSFEIVLKWMKYLAIFGAIGVAVQYFLPNIHKSIISLFFSGEGVRYISGYANRGYYSGFFHQVGDTAFYVSAGIISFIFQEKKKRIDHFMIFILFVSLILLGKRSLLLFLIGAMMITYILNGSKNSSLSRSSIVVFSLICLFFSLKAMTQMFGDIKLFEKLAYTIAYIETGDMDGLMQESGRLHLTELAKQLLEQNPIFGIGWAQFSKISGELYASGIGTSVHNIYLQLLCETGYVGLSAFLLGVFSALRYTLKVRKRLKKLGFKSSSYYGRLWSVSFTGQILFLTFGFVENPLYNANCLLFYMFMVLLNVSISNELENLMSIGMSVDRHSTCFYKKTKKWG